MSKPEVMDCSDNKASQLLEIPSILCSDKYKLVQRGEVPEGFTIQAAHVVLFAKTDRKFRGSQTIPAYVLMTLRSDGRFGFPGGIVEDNESITDAVNRETREEIGVECNITEKDLICSHFTTSQRFGNLLLHGFAKEVSLEKIEEAEVEFKRADHFMDETIGVTRIPLVTYDEIKGLPQFLMNNFAGNAKLQLMIALYKHEILHIEDISNALTLSKSSSGKTPVIE